MFCKYLWKKCKEEDKHEPFLNTKDKTDKKKSITTNYDKYNNRNVGGEHKYSPEERVGSVVERKCFIRKHLSELGFEN